MLNRRQINYVGVLLALFLVATPVMAIDEVAPKPIAKSERCPVCGMYPAQYPKWHSQIVFKDGEHSSFDSQMDMFRFLHNMSKYDKRHNTESIGRIYVLDYEKGGWLDAKQAYFITGSKVDGPMGPDLPAFENKEQALAFTKKSGGEVLNYQQVTPTVINGEQSH